MARHSIAMLVFATLSVALFGFVECAPVEESTLTVDTADLYFQLLSGQVERKYDNYRITTNVAPSLFSDIKSFAAANPVPQAKQIHFDSTTTLDRVTLEPQTKSVWTNIRIEAFGEKRYDILPADYKSYELSVERLTDADLDIIQNWSSAEFVGVSEYWQKGAATSPAVHRRFYCLSKFNMHLKTSYIVLE